MRLAILFIIILNLLLATNAFFIIQQQQVVARDSAIIAYNLSPNGRWHNAVLTVRNYWENTKTSIVNFFTRNNQQPETATIEKLRDLLANIETAQQQSRRAAWVFALSVSTVALLIVVLGLLFFRGHYLRMLALHLLLSSITTLLVGLFTPMLFITVAAEVWFLGDIVFQHDAKGIMQTTIGLWQQGTFGLALLIALFSIVLPIIKFIFTLLICFNRNIASAKKQFGYMQHVGKWSMADVFALSTVMSFLAFNKMGMTEASLGMGIYFFSAYCLLSLLATWLLARAIRTS